MTISQSLIIQKLTLIAKYEEELKKFLKFSDQEILNAESGYLYAIERVFQLIVDAMIDINQHFIREANLETVDDLQSTFKVLGENKILKEDFALKISPIVAVRNMLVHQYEKVDSKLFLRNLRTNFEDFAEYQDQIKNYLAKK